MYKFTFSYPRNYLEVSGQLYAPAALPHRKEPPPRYALGRRLDGHQSWSGRFRDVNILEPAETRTLTSRPSSA
jgi:hypothetical protein